MKNLNGGVVNDTSDELIQVAFNEKVEQISLSWKQYYQLSRGNKDKLFKASFDSSSEGITFYLNVGRDRPHKSVFRLQGD